LKFEISGDFGTLLEPLSLCRPLPTDIVIWWWRLVSCSIRFVPWLEYRRKVALIIRNYIFKPISNCNEVPRSKTFSAKISSKSQTGIHPQWYQIQSTNENTRLSHV